MDFKELLIGVLTKVHNKTEEEITPLIFDDKGEVAEKAFDNILSLDTARVSKFKTDITKKFDDGYSKGKAETAGQIEKHFKEQFGIDGDNYEAISEALKEQLATSKTKGKEITDEDIKRHPFFLAYEKSAVPKQQYEKLQSDFDGFKNGVDRKMKLDRVKEKAMLHLDEFNPEYPDVPEIKANLTKVYLSDFEQYDDFNIEADGTIVAIKDGKRVEDEHGNPMKFSDLSKKHASGYFKFKKQGERQGTQNKNEQTTTGQFSIPAFQSKAEIADYYTKRKAEGATPEELKEIIAVSNRFKS